MRNRRFMFLLTTFTAILQFLGCSISNKVRRRMQLQQVNNWVCVYIDTVAVQDLKKFDLAILDADSHPALTLLQENSPLLIGYLSLGEVADYRWYWDLISSKSYILDKNPNWGSWFIDIRNEEWHTFLLDIVIPHILNQGFSGLFLDTVDNAEYLEKYHSKKYPGAQKAMVKLIKSIRKRYPQCYLIANRGYTILEEIGDSVDALLAESTFTTVDFASHSVRLVNKDEYTRIIARLKSVQKKHKLTILTLDYAEPDDTKTIKTIISNSRSNNFIPYVSTPDLNKVFLHTLAF